MNPIYNEYITFLKDVTGENLNNLKEGYFWLDNLIIKGFDKNGQIHKFYRVNISDDLKVSIKIPKTGYSKIEYVNLASWQEVIEINKERIIELENKSKQLIKEKMDKFTNYIPLIPVSMGKDSQLTCHLVRECFPDTKAIFNNTSLDCIDTYLMAKNFNNCEIMTPKQGFYQYIKETKVIPTRFARFCCRIFKVGEMVNQLDHSIPYLMFMGMRNEESNTRSGYEDEWVNEAEWGKTKWQGILPIRKWTELDVWLYTLWKNIEVNSKYKKGYSRVGCHIACPYYTKSVWSLDKYWYPTMRKRWEDILKEDFVNNKKWIIMNCTLEEYINQAWNGGVFRSEPTDDVINEFAQYNNLDIEVAKQYFNKYCSNGCVSQTGKVKRIKNKDVISMNMKLHGRQINKFLCKKCLMEMYNMNEDTWNKQIETFKQSECVLFN